MIQEKEYQIKESILRRLIYKGVVFGANQGWGFDRWVKETIEHELGGK